MSAAGRLHPTLTEATLVATAFKLLLFPAYKSTDFEVHRNWLAITHSLPMQKWYLESTSEWTLDYPPFFAGFEWLLSQAAGYFDPRMLDVNNLGYDSPATVFFQRLSVIFTELILVYALSRILHSAPATSKPAVHAIVLSIFFSPGLLIIDHIHFQYNGFLYGILLLSLHLARSSQTLLLSGTLFTILLCLKHIYLYLAPAYFVYLLRVYCLAPGTYFNLRINNCFKLGASVLGVFSVAFGPFVLWGQLPQLTTRLFPFARGLCHAYWAPNAWAVYSLIDRLLLYGAPRLGISADQAALDSVTRGRVGDTSFAVLPEITPRMTFILTVAFQSLCLLKLFARPSYDNFVGAVTLCGYASFLFGWHVHEKAILLVIFPFSLLALKDRRYFSAFRPLAVAGHISLFPLIFTAPEFPIKIIYTLVWLAVFLWRFNSIVPRAPTGRQFLLDRPATAFIIVSIPLIAYTSLVHRWLFHGKYEFLPLMLTSSYSAIGIFGSWVGFSWLFFTS